MSLNSHKLHYSIQPLLYGMEYHPNINPFKTKLYSNILIYNLISIKIILKINKYYQLLYEIYNNIKYTLCIQFMYR